MKNVKFNRNLNLPTNSLDRFFNDNFFNNNIVRDAWNKTLTVHNPAVNIVEHSESFTIEVAAPGLLKEDFNLNLDKDLLTIKVSKEATVEKEGEKWHRKEFSYSSFERSFRLPETILKDKISAKYDNGVLSVILPKQEEAIEKPAREISIS